MAITNHPSENTTHCTQFPKHRLGISWKHYIQCIYEIGKARTHQKRKEDQQCPISSEYGWQETPGTRNWIGCGLSTRETSENKKSWHDTVQQNLNKIWTVSKCGPISRRKCNVQYIHENVDLHSTITWSGDTSNALMSLMSGKEMRFQVSPKTCRLYVQNTHQIRPSSKL